MSGHRLPHTLMHMIFISEMSIILAFSNNNISYTETSVFMHAGHLSSASSCNIVHQAQILILHGAQILVQVGDIYTTCIYSPLHIIINAVSFNFVKVCMHIVLRETFTEIIKQCTYNTIIGGGGDNSLVCILINYKKTLKTNKINPFFFTIQ